MTLIEQVKKSWAGVLVVGAIVGGTFYALNALDARAAEIAKKEVQATINKEMIEGAKKAAKDAVAEIVPEVAKQAAREAVREMLAAQKEEKKAEAVKNKKVP
jgi:hypothetical protein